MHVKIMTTTASRSSVYTIGHNGPSDEGASVHFIQILLLCQNYQHILLLLSLLIIASSLLPYIYILYTYVLMFSFLARNSPVIINSLTNPMHPLSIIQ